MKLGIILLNWNAADYTERCIRVLQNWHIIRPNIYVVDNGSIDGGLRYSKVGKVPVFLLQSPVNRGYAGGNNLGIKRALDDGCEYILLMNTDASISEEHIAMLIDHLKKDSGIGCIGPTVHQDNLVFVGGRDIALHFDTRNTHMRTHSYQMPISVDYVPGMVFLTRRDVITRTGYLDEDFFFSGEIADFCRRATREGYRSAILPEARADHVPITDNPHRRTLYQYYSLRNRFLYLRKHHPRIQGFLESLWILLGVHMYVLAIIRGKKMESMAIRLAIKDGVRGIFGDQNDKFLT